MERHDIKLVHVKLTDTATARDLAEKAAGRNIGGSIDLYGSMVKILPQ